MWRVPVGEGWLGWIERQTHGSGSTAREDGLFGIFRFSQAKTWLHTTPGGGSLQSSMCTLVVHERIPNWTSDRSVKVAFSTYVLTTQVSLLEQCKHSVGILQLWSCPVVPYVILPTLGIPIQSHEVWPGFDSYPLKSDILNINIC